MQFVGISSSPAASSSSSTETAALTVQEAYVDMIAYTRQFLPEFQSGEDFQDRIREIARHANPIFTVLTHSEATKKRIRKVIHKEQRALDASGLNGINFKLMELFKGLITCFNHLKDPDEIKSFRKFMLDMQGNFGAEVEASLKAKNALLQQYRNEYAKKSPVKIHTEWPQLKIENDSINYVLKIGNRTWILPGAVNSYLDANWIPPELFLRDLCHAQEVIVDVFYLHGLRLFSTKVLLQSGLEAIQANGNRLPYKTESKPDQMIAEERDLPIGVCHDDSMFKEIFQESKILENKEHPSLRTLLESPGSGFVVDLIKKDTRYPYITAEAWVSPEIFDLVITKIKENPQEVLTEYKAWAEKSDTKNKIIEIPSNYHMKIVDKDNDDRAYMIEYFPRENKVQVSTLIKNKIFHIGYHCKIHDGCDNNIIIDAHAWDGVESDLYGTPTQIGPMILDGKNVTEFIRSRLSFLIKKAKEKDDEYSITLEDRCPEEIQRPSQSLLNNCYDKTWSRLFANAKISCESLAMQLPGVKVSLVRQQPKERFMYFEVSHQEHEQLMSRLNNFVSWDYSDNFSKLEEEKLESVVHIIPNSEWIKDTQRERKIDGMAIRCLSDIEDFLGYEFTIVSPFEKVAPIVIETGTPQEVNEIVSFFLKNEIVNPFQLHVEGTKIYLSGNVNLSSLQMPQAKPRRLKGPEGASSLAEPEHLEPISFTKAERLELVKKAFRDLLPRSFRKKAKVKENDDGTALQLSLNIKLNNFSRDLVNTALYFLSKTVLSGCQILEVSQQGNANVLQLSYSGDLLERLETLPKIRQRLKLYFEEALSQNNEDGSNSRALTPYYQGCTEVTLGCCIRSLTPYDSKLHLFQMGGERSLLKSFKAGRIDEVVDAVRRGVNPNRLLVEIFYFGEKIQDPFTVIKALVEEGGLHPNVSVERMTLGPVRLLTLVFKNHFKVLHENKVEAVDFLLNHGASLFNGNDVSSPLLEFFGYGQKYEEDDVQVCLLMLEHLQKNRAEGDGSTELLQEAFDIAIKGSGKFPDERLLQKMVDMGAEIAPSHIEKLLRYIDRH